MYFGQFDIYILTVFRYFIYTVVLLIARGFYFHVLLFSAFSVYCRLYHYHYIVATVPLSYSACVLSGATMYSSNTSTVCWESKK